MTKRPHLTFKSGRWRFRIKRDGRDTTRTLPGEPGTPDFEAAYSKLLRLYVGEGAKGRSNTVSDLIQTYRQSPGFLNLKPSTRADYEFTLSAFHDAFGDAPLEAVDREVAQAFVSAHDSPSMQAKRARVLSVLGKRALQANRLQANPWTQLEAAKAKGEGVQAWPLEKVAILLNDTQGGLRRAAWLAIYTGQRLSDVVALRWDQLEGDTLRLVQAKTGKPIAVTLPGPLLSEIADWPREGPRMVGLSAEGLKTAFQRARPGLGLDGLKWHGLRATACSIMAAAGLGVWQIAALSGHSGVQMVERYVAAAAGEQRASEGAAAIADALKGRI